MNVSNVLKTAHYSVEDQIVRSVTVFSTIHLRSLFSDDGGYLEIFGVQLRTQLIVSLSRLIGSQYSVCVFATVIHILSTGHVFHLTYLFRNDLLHYMFATSRLQKRNRSHLW